MKLKTLEDYPNLNERISLKREMIEVLESARESTTKIIDGMPKSEGYNRDKLLNYTVRLMEWVERLNDDVLEHTAVRQEVDEWMQTLGKDERAIIAAKYLDCPDGKRVTWLQVAQKTGYSEKQPLYILRRMYERGVLERE